MNPRDIVDELLQESIKEAWNRAATATPPSEPKTKTLNVISIKTTYVMHGRKYTYTQR